MSYHERMQAQEELLAAAHRVMSGRITDRLPGANDDAEAEYAEDGLVHSAQKLARAKIAERLGKLAGGDAKPALSERILRYAALATSQTPDIGDSRIKDAAAEAAVMELALLEIARGIDAGDLNLEEVLEMAAEALPDRAGRA